jgi:hypothetical protein
MLVYMPVILYRAGDGSSSNNDIYQIMFIQTLSKTYSGSVPAVLIAMHLVKSALGRKGTLLMSIIASAVVLFGFLVPNYVAARLI